MERILFIIWVQVLETFPVHCVFTDTSPYSRGKILEAKIFWTHFSYTKALELWAKKIRQACQNYTLLVQRKSLRNKKFWKNLTIFRHRAIFLQKFSASLASLHSTSSMDLFVEQKFEKLLFFMVFSEVELILFQTPLITLFAVWSRQHFTCTGENVERKFSLKVQIPLFFQQVR